MKVFVADLTLSHFRSHKLARLMLDGRPVVLYGPNGAGKTNLLEAISLLSPGRGLRRAGAEDIIRRPEAIGWKIAANLTAPGADHDITITAEPGQARAVQVDGKAATQNALAGLVSIVWLVPSQDRLWTEGAEGRRRFLDRLTLSFAPDHADAVLGYEKAMRDRNRLLKDQVRDAHWYDALEAQMAMTAEIITANRATALARMTAAQWGAETAFPAADLTLEEVEPLRRPRFRRSLCRIPPARPCRRAHADRAAPHRYGRHLSGQGRACATMFHRRAEGAVDLADPRQCPRAQGRYRDCAGCPVG